MAEIDIVFGEEIPKQNMPPKTGGPMLRLTLPKAMTPRCYPDVHDNFIAIPLRAGDVKLSWQDYFGRQETQRCRELYQHIVKASVHNHLEIVDRRPTKDVRKSWTLKNTVGQFIDSFKRNRQLYTANLKVTRCRTNDMMMMPPPPPHSVRMTVIPQGQGPSSSDCTTMKPTTSNSAQRMPPPPPPPFERPTGTFPKLNIPFGDDDANSMANSMASSVWSVDSLSDLTSKGVRIQHWRSEVVPKFVKYAEDELLMRIFNEYENMKKRRKKWMHVSTKMPALFNLLAILFDGRR